MTDLAQTRDRQLPPSAYQKHVVPGHWRQAPYRAGSPAFG